MKHEIVEIKNADGEIVQPINAKEFGLTPKSANNIIDKFTPAIAERDLLMPEYLEIIGKKITKEVELAAKVLDGKLQKCGAQMDDTHKAEKNMYLQAGRFVDAKKNREKLPVTQAREKLKVIFTTSKVKAAAKEEKLESKRIKELGNLGMIAAIMPAELGKMDEAVYEHYKSGVEATQKAQKDAAQKVIDDAAAKKKVDDAALATANAAKAKAEQETERIRKETEKKAEDLRIKNAKIAEDLRIKTESEKSIADAKAKKIADELKKKQDEELAKEVAKQDLLIADDSVKFQQLIDEIKSMQTKFTFKSDKNKQKFADFIDLSNKVIVHLKK